MSRMRWWPRRRNAIYRPVASAEYIGDTWYDARSAEILRRVDGSPAGGWRGWAGRLRAGFRSTGEAPIETRALTAFPWNVGNPLGYQQADQDRALSLIPVYAAVRLLSDTVATLPVKTYRRDGDNRVPMPGLPQLFRQLDDDGTLTDWLHRCMTSLALRGNAYGLVTARDGMEFPTSIYWLDPSLVGCDETNPMRPAWYWNGRRVPAEDFVHIPWFTIAGKVQGLSPIEAYARTVNIGLQAQDYGLGWFDSGGIPPGTFKNTQKTVSQEEARIISERLVAAIRSRRPITYGADWDYNAITIPPEQAQFIQTMRLTATQIASIYGIPPEMIGGESGGPLTYNTLEQNTQFLATMTLRPWLVKLERKFSSILPARQYVKLNADAIVRADLTARYQSYLVAHQIGLLTNDEMRAMEDRPPLPPDQVPNAEPLRVSTTPGEPNRLRVVS
jgi:HK97 family phage portal protein